MSSVVAERLFRSPYSREVGLEDRAAADPAEHVGRIGGDGGPAGRGVDGAPARALDGHVEVGGDALGVDAVGEVLPEVAEGGDAVILLAKYNS